MPPRTPINERRRYLQFLKEAKGRDESSIDAVAKALERYDSATRFRDFRKFHIDMVRALKDNLVELRNARTGERLYAATVHSTLSACKAFYKWLADQDECRRKIN